MLLLCLCGAAYYFLLHERLQVSSIKFYQNNYVTTEKLDAAAKPYLGEPVWWVAFSGRLSNRILSQFPQISKLHIHIYLPNKLVVAVEEKSAWVSFVTEIGPVVIAKDGTLLAHGMQPVSAADQKHLIVVFGVSKAQFLDIESRRRLLTVIDETTTIIYRCFPKMFYQLKFYLSGNENGEMIIEGMDVMMDTTLPIRIGPITAIDRKLTDLKTFIDKTNVMDYQTIDYIDLCVPGKVIVHESAP